MPGLACVRQEELGRLCFCSFLFDQSISKADWVREQCKIVVVIIYQEKKENK